MWQQPDGQHYGHSYICGHHSSLTNMINNSSHYRTTDAYNNNATDVLSHYSDAWSPTTHIKQIQVHTILMALMCYQATLMSECPITHITGIWTLTTHIYVYALSGYTVDWMPYYTHQRNMDAHQLLCVDVLPVYSAWMPYYIHYRNMNAHHYVCTDVLSTDSVGWMPYDTHHKNTRINNYVCVDVLSGYSVG